MLKQIRNMQDLVGKTIKDIKLNAFDDSLVIYTEDSFAMFNATGSDGASIFFEDSKLVPERDLVKFGICTREEAEDWMQNFRAKQAKKQEDRDRETYEKLKARFEPPVSVNQK